MVKIGTNPNMTNGRGQTPVWIAAMNGHTKTVRTLVKECHADECGDDPNTADEGGLAPVVIAAHNDKSEMVRAIVHECDADPFPALRDTTIYDNNEMIWRLVREC